MNLSINAISLDNPAWLLILFIPCFLTLWSKTLKKRKRENFSDRHLWHWIFSENITNKPRDLILIFLAWLFIAVSLSGPIIKNTEHKDHFPYKPLNLIFVVDISPSMAVTDKHPSRLKQVQLKLQDLAPQLVGTKVALISYSSYAYVHFPLTYDHNLLSFFVNSLDVTLSRKYGSNLTMALEKSLQIIEDNKNEQHAIVLFSDGEADSINDAINTAKRIKKRNTPIYTIGVGTLAGAPVRNIENGQFIVQDDQVVISALNENNLKNLSSLSEGKYSSLDSIDSSWSSLLSPFIAAGYLKTEVSEITPETSTNLFQWFLLIGFLLFLWQNMHGRLMISLIIMTPTLIFPLKSNASFLNEWIATSALKNNDYHKAKTYFAKGSSFNELIGVGVAAYRLKDWQSAQLAFEQAVNSAITHEQRAKSSYNLGNVKVKLNQLSSARNLFKKALRWQPHHKRATFNLSLIEERIKLNSTIFKNTSNTKKNASSGKFETQALNQVNNAPNNSLLERHKIKPKNVKKPTAKTVSTIIKKSQRLNKTNSHMIRWQIAHQESEISFEVKSERPW